MARGNPKVGVPASWLSCHNQKMGLRIASYNIRKAVGLDWKRDPARILSVLNEIDADVVALQEADQRLAPRPSALPRELIASETDFIVADLAENNVSLGWHGNAMLVRRGLSLRNTDRLPLPGLEPRGAVRATVDSGHGLVSIVGTHLGLLRSWRRKQLQTIRDHMSRMDMPRTVIVGDFNEWSVNGGLEALEADFTLLAPGKTFHASQPVAALDRIALGGGLEVQDARVHETDQARVASDHLPLWVDVCLAH